MGAALTTTGRVGTARRPGSGKQDGKVHECRNQWLNPLKRCTGSNLVDMGRAAVHVVSDSWERRLRRRFLMVGQEAPVKACGVTEARLQGKSWVPTPSTGAQ